MSQMRAAMPRPEPMAQQVAPGLYAVKGARGQVTLKEVSPVTAALEDVKAGKISMEDVYKRFVYETPDGSLIHPPDLKIEKPADKSQEPELPDTATAEERYNALGDKDQARIDREAESLLKMRISARANASDAGDIRNRRLKNCTGYVPRSSSAPVWEEGQGQHAPARAFRTRA